MSVRQIWRLAREKLYAEVYANAVGATFPQSLQGYEIERSFWHSV